MQKIKPTLYIESFVESRIYRKSPLYLLKRIIRAILACPKNILCYIVRTVLKHQTNKLEVLKQVLYNRLALLYKAG